MSERTNNGKPAVDEHALDLLNRSIDGELSSQEQAELEQLIVDSEGLGSDYLELIALSSLLDQAPEHDPPDFLQSAIERQVRLPVADKNSGQRESIAAWLNASWFRTGFALAAGVFLTFGVYEMGSEPITHQDTASLVGTVVKNPSPKQDAPPGTILFETGTLDGRAELKNVDDLFVLDLRLNSDEPSEIVVNFAGRGLAFEDITPEQGKDGAVTAGDGSVTIASNGEQHYTMRFRRTSETAAMNPLGLEIFNNNKLIHEAEISVSEN